METSERIGFRRCFTCGKWHPEAGSYTGRFCSRECARAYRRCPVCGEYFPAEDGAADDFCSAECAGVDAKDRPEEMAEVAEDADNR